MERTLSLFIPSIPRTFCGEPEKNLKITLGLLAQSKDVIADITILPAMGLSSPCCGDMFRSRTLTQTCYAALEALAEATKDRHGFIITGLPIEHCGAVTGASAILHGGKIVALLPSFEKAYGLALTEPGGELIPANTLFACGDARFRVLPCSPDDMPIYAPSFSSGCDLVIVHSFAPVIAGMAADMNIHAMSVSNAFDVVVAVVSGVPGATSSPRIYDMCLPVIAKAGELVEPDPDKPVTIDIDIIRAGKKPSPYAEPAFTGEALGGDYTPVWLEGFPRNPFVPLDRELCDAYLIDLFSLQATSLAIRASNTGINNFVIGISGGLDSTCALLAAAYACDLLDVPRTNITAVTMPGDGTGKRTLTNAEGLIKAVGATHKNVPIGRIVSEHLLSIGHDGSADVVFENAQARERTQILLDIANAVNGIMIGTGDMSEEALGFCTYGGDQFAGFNLNTCLTKTTLRQMVDTIIFEDLFEDANIYLRDILDTPVSPELLPVSDGGDMPQKTEEILGPYELHENFLYYLVFCNMTPSKVLEYVKTDFSQYDEKYLKDKLKMFIRRFFTSQFKRSCAPDCAAITKLNLHNADYYIPSDMNANWLIEQIN
jgi:NAD+ synthase (glutamine-hydrolysing)